MPVLFYIIYTPDISFMPFLQAVAVDLKLTFLSVASLGCWCVKTSVNVSSFPERSFILSGLNPGDAPWTNLISVFFNEKRRSCVYMDVRHLFIQHSRPQISHC